MSMGRYVAMLSEGTSSYFAIPVFPSRMFRHSAIYVRTDGPVREPRDLCGARVGIPEWAQTAGVYVRGLLADTFDVGLDSIDWVQGGLQQVGREEEVRLRLPKGIRIRKAEGRTLNDMLLSGDLDALISAHPPGVRSSKATHLCAVSSTMWVKKKNHTGGRQGFSRSCTQSSLKSIFLIAIRGSPLICKRLLRSPKTTVFGAQENLPYRDFRFRFYNNSSTKLVRILVRIFGLMESRPTVKHWKLF